jgi:two-component system, LytTR family, response regulator LytT
MIKCIIIEDERHAIKHLENELAKTGYEYTVMARIETITEAVKYLKNNNADLIFLDVQLADGLSFEIFDHIQLKTPVIFTTSYDQYITKAFEINSISYILKPVDSDELKAALDKYSFLYNHSMKTEDINQKIAKMSQEYQKRFLVQTGNKMVSIQVEDTAYYKVENKRFLILTTKDKSQYLIDANMEFLEKRLDPELFFRINRQYIVGLSAIESITRLDNGRITIETNPPAKEELIVSGDRAADFKHWLNH